MVSLSPAALLLLAAQISVLTYHIGVLIYMMPIPVRGLKKWAPILIQDSIWAVILVLIFSSLLYLSNIIASWSGYDLHDVLLYAKTRISAILTAQFMMKLFLMMSSILTSAFSKVLSFFMIPLTLNFYALIYSLSIIVIIVSIMMSAKASLAALGIALMSIPFRLGRNAGASILAFSLVANAMLPYLPLWVSFFYQNLIQGYSSSLDLSRIATYNSYSIWGIVYGEAHTHPHGGLVFFNNTDLGTTYIFRIRLDGGYYVLQPNSIPNGTYNIYVEYLGLKTSYNNVKIPDSAKLTYELEEAPYRLDIHVRNIVFLNPDIALFINDCTQVSISKDTETLSIIKCTPDSNYVDVKIYAPSTCTIKLKVENGNIYSINSREKRWRGIRVNIYEYGIYGGAGYPIGLKLEKNGKCDIDWNNVIAGKIVYAQKPENTLHFEILIYAIIYMTALPIAIFSFLTIMSLIIVAVARVLGASYSRVIFEL